MQDWFPGKQWGYGLGRRFFIIFTILAICLGVSLAAPGDSAQIVVITGASGVFLSCYLIPIINHLMLYCGRCAAFEAFEIQPPKVDKEASAQMKCCCGISECAKCPMQVRWLVPILHILHTTCDELVILPWYSILNDAEKIDRTL